MKTTYLINSLCPEEFGKTDTSKGIRDFGIGQLGSKSWHGGVPWRCHGLWLRELPPAPFPRPRQKKETNPGTECRSLGLSLTTCKMQIVTVVSHMLTVKSKSDRGRTTSSTAPDRDEQSTLGVIISQSGWRSSVPLIQFLRFHLDPSLQSHKSPLAELSPVVRFQWLLRWPRTRIRTRGAPPCERGNILRSGRTLRARRRDGGMERRGMHPSTPILHDFPVKMRAHQGDS